MANEPDNIRVRFLLSVAFFLCVMPMLLIYVIYYAREHFPAEEPPPQMMGGPGGQQQPMPSWRRWLQPREPTPQQRADAARDSNSRTRVLGSQDAGTGTTAVPMSRDHLAMRELAESQYILVHQGERTKQQALDIFRSSPASGAARSFEDKRLQSRMMLIEFADSDYDAALIQDFRDAAVDVANQPEASFEEFYYAGVATLFNGEDGLARRYLSQALDIWPARGLGYGNVYFFMLLAQGIDGAETPFYNMLGDFRATYPNWMYVETYMSDIEHLETVYPGAPLLGVARGYCYSLVHNDAAAQEAYQGVQKHRASSFKTRRIVAGWLQEIEEARRR